MSTVIGHYRNGTVEIDGPPPAAWVEGTDLRIGLDTPEQDFDITGDKPEEITAWLNWYEEFAMRPRDADAARDMEEILRRNKEEGKSMFEAHGRSAEELFR